MLQQHNTAPKKQDQISSIQIRDTLQTYNNKMTVKKNRKNSTRMPIQPPNYQIAKD